MKDNVDAAENKKKRNRINKEKVIKAMKPDTAGAISPMTNRLSGQQV